MWRVRPGGCPLTATGETRDAFIHSLHEGRWIGRMQQHQNPCNYLISYEILYSYGVLYWRIHS